MVQYACNVCDKYFAKKSSYDKHIKSNIHNKKKNIIIDELKEKLKKKEDELKEKLKKKDDELKKKEDKLKDKENKLKEKLKEKDYELKLKDIKIDKLENQVELYKHYNNKLLISNNNNSNNNVNIGNKQYVINYYSNNPPLEKLEDYSIIKNSCNADSEEDHVRELCHYYKKNKLAKYLGKFLVDQYRKEDKTKQSLFNTDSSRFNFLISDYVSKIKKNKWIYDNKGIYVSSIVIDPLLNYVKNISERQNINYCKKINEVNNDKNSIFSYSDLVSYSNNVVNDVSNDKQLRKNILIYISPYFKLLKE